MLEGTTLTTFGKEEGAKALVGGEVAENPPQDKKERNREVRNLNDHLSSGLNDSAPNNSSMAACFKDDGTSRKRGRPNGNEVLFHDWYHTDNVSSDGSRAHVIGDRPMFYHSD